MTITIAWERGLPGQSELLFCSDSRLTGGGNIDVCQKVFPLPREDAAVGFCGSTLIAFPIINQFISYVRHYKKNLDRALDGSELPRRFAALANQFLVAYIDPVDLRAELLETSFLIGCWSWRLRRPVISQIKYDGGPRNYVASYPRFPKAKGPKLHRTSQFAMIGDLRSQYFSSLAGVMNCQTADRLNMEPFTALATMLADPTFTDRRRDLRGPIGGAPQLLKVYPFLRTVEFGIFWPSRAAGRLHLNGRELFDYEKVAIPKVDASTLEVEYPLEGLPEAGG
jgi:hypothetical protein